MLLCIFSQLIPARNFIHQIQKVRYLQAFVKKAIAGAHKVFLKTKNILPLEHFLCFEINDGALFCHTMSEIYYLSTES